MRTTRFTVGIALVSAGLLAVSTIPASSSPVGQTSASTHVSHSKSSHDHHGHYKHHKHQHKTKTPTPKVVAQHLAGPLTFSVEGGNAFYVGQSFAGAVTHVKKGKTPTNIVSIPGMDMTAVSTYKGALTWAQTTLVNERPSEAVIVRRSKSGHIRTVADTFAYERKANPDGKISYGPLGLSAECLASVPAELAPYKGGIDSHPYGSVTSGKNTYVADAGSNAILRVSKSGKISTVAVIPPAKVKITAGLAAGAGLPDCAIGHTFAFEGVPTDVEVGRNGYLYVTSLPGGPEDGSTGALGSVYRVNPRTGSVKLVASGFAGATGLAISNHGTIYVAEMFGNQVSSISRNGHVKPFVTLNQPAAVEFRSGHLYVSTNALGDGNIVSMRAK